jgi:hypothetical protein
MRSRAVSIRLAAAVAALVLTAPVAMAQNQWRGSSHDPGPWGQQGVDGNLVQVQVLVGHRAAPLYNRLDASDRWYFEAFQGREYSLRLQNTTGERIGVLIAVDGLNVVNGERSNLQRTEPMYVLDPWETATIRGWRTSLDDVRKFVFVDEERSYAERTDQANGDLGWIRVLAFRENRPQAYYRRGATWGQTKSLYGDGAPSAPAPEAQNPPAPRLEAKERADKDLADGQRRSLDESAPGTGWGDRSRDPVTRTWFVAEWAPTDRIALRYEYESGLRALGILPWHNSRVWQRDQGELGFAQPPRW